MGRSVSFADAATWYVPDVGANREDPEPFAVLIAPLSGAELAAIERAKMPARLRGLTEGSDTDAISARLQFVSEEIVRRRVLEVRGYTLRVQAEGKPDEVLEPRNGDELVDTILRGPTSEHDLLFAIAMAARDRSVLTEGARGNFGSPSASGPAATATPGAGDAGTVAGPGLEAASTNSSATASVTATRTSAGPGLPSSDAARGPSSGAPTTSCSAGGATGATSDASRGGAAT